MSPDQDNCAVIPGRASSFARTRNPARGANGDAPAFRFAQQRPETTAVSKLAFGRFPVSCSLNVLVVFRLEIRQSCSQKSLQLLPSRFVVPSKTDLSALTVSELVQAYVETIELSTTVDHIGRKNRLFGQMWASPSS